VVIQLFRWEKHPELDFHDNLTLLLLQVVVSASALFVDSLGRRVLLMVSAVGMAVCMSLLGAYLNFERNLGVRWDWLTIALLMLYIVLFSIGFGPIAWVYMGEVIPPGAKG